MIFDILADEIYTFHLSILMMKTYKKASKILLTFVLEILTIGVFRSWSPVKNVAVTVDAFVLKFLDHLPMQIRCDPN